MPLNPVLNGAANLATSQVSVKTTLTAIIGQRTSRRGVIIQNITGSDIIYIGTEVGVSTTQGYPIPAVANASIYIPTTAAIYGIVASTPQTIGVLEIFDQG